MDYIDRILAAERVRLLADVTARLRNDHGFSGAKEEAIKIIAMAEAHYAKPLAPKVKAEQKAEEKTYRIGRLFDIGGMRHILAQVGHREAAFICLATGNRCRNGIFVHAPMAITNAELRQMTSDTFTPIDGDK